MAAALAGASLGHAEAARAQPTDAPASPPEPPPDPQRFGPQICLSDMDLEAEVERQDATREDPPTSGDDPGPEICLSVIRWGDGEGAHRHDGWYLRMAVGAAVSWIEGNADERALGPAWQLAGGVTAGPALVVGISLDGAFSRAAVVSTGPFVDYFPWEDGGLHVGGTAGPAILIDDRPGGPPAGAGGGLWIGQDFWVGDQLSLGPQLKATGHWLHWQDKGVEAETVSLLFSGLWH